MDGSTEYKNKWLSENKERINLAVPKGYKDRAKAAATAEGKSLNSFIIEAINEKIEREAEYNE